MAEKKINPTILPASPLAQYISHKREIKKSLEKVLNNGIYILSNQVELFEKQFSEYIGVKYGVGVNSGTDAIKLALLCLGIKSGDEIIVPSHTSQGSIVGMYELGAVPVFVDIEISSYNLDPTKIEACITDKTKAILAVHLYGQSCDMDAILSISKKHKLLLIEDASQAHGAKYKGKNVGSFGDVSCFSCYPTKNLGAIGDAGILVTNNFQLAQKAKGLRQYGWLKERYVSEELGFNSRLDELQAAILNVKLPYLESDNEKRRKIAKYYNQHLIQSVLKPTECSSCTHVYHQYVIRVSERAKLQKYLQSQGIMTAVLYPLALHQQSSLKNFHKTNSPLPVTEKIVSEILSLPIYPELKVKDVQYIVRCFNKFFTK